MNYKHALLYYRTITPVHVGCGQAVGVVDLPLIRERATGYPYLPGSGIRGSLRDLFELNDKELTKTLFGPENDQEASEYAGCVAIHDARLLFYPVRSDHEVFLWLTCPLVLQRFNRDREAFGVGHKLDIPGLQQIEHGAFIGPVALGARVHLEEFCFQSAQDKNKAEANLRNVGELVGGVIGELELEDRLLLVSNRSFSYFVKHATMLTQHNRLTSAKTVAGGALFSIESLPPETVLYGVIGATQERRKLRNNNADQLKNFKSTLMNVGNTKYLHLGGKESIGMGVTQMTWGS